ncbi:hypothetical protein KJ966_10745 [bacterium]|nr:hypothetical protein [bacterium]
MELSNKPKRTFQTHYETDGKNKISLGHPKFKARADRLDLITNNMIGMKVAIDNRNFALCDISETGFSYAEKVPVNKNLSFKQVKQKVDQVASSNYGKTLRYVCFFEGEPERGGVTTTGTIKNHHIFLILSADEIRQTVTSYLQSKSIRRSHDPQGFFSKLDLLLSASQSTNNSRHNITTLGVVMNTTFQNLILEIGAPSDIFDKLYQGYINKAVYVKYGVAIANKKEALNLVQFAIIKNSETLKREQKRKENKYGKKLALIERINQKHSYKDFIFTTWKKCLEHFRLDLNLDLPKIDNEKVAIKLKEEMIRYDGHLELLADPDFMEGSSIGLENFLCNGLYWHLIEMDKKYFDRDVIKKDIRKVISLTYEEYLKIEMLID